VQSIWLEHDHERLDSPLQLHFDPAICLRTHNHDHRGFALGQLLAVENMNWIAEVKLDQRCSTGRYWMHYGCSANLDLTLNVEANELLEARSGPAETDAKQDPTPFQNRREGACRLLCQILGLMP